MIFYENESHSFPLKNMKEFILIGRFHFELTWQLPSPNNYMLHENPSFYSPRFWAFKKREAIQNQFWSENCQFPLLLEWKPHNGRHLKKVYGNGWSACKISWWSEEEASIAVIPFHLCFWWSEWRIENLGQEETQIDMCVYIKIS